MKTWTRSTSTAESFPPLRRASSSRKKRKSICRNWFSYELYEKIIRDKENFIQNYVENFQVVPEKEIRYFMIRRGFERRATFLKLWSESFGRCLITPKLFFRAWCLIELVSAKRNDILITPSVVKSQTKRTFWSRRASQIVEILAEQRSLWRITKMPW